MVEYHIACGQFRTDPGNKQKNIRILGDQAAEAKRRGAELIVFPEMCLTGYLLPEELPPLAESIHGELFDGLRRLTERIGIAITVGFPELDQVTGLRHNSFAVIQGQGIPLLYRKVHLWDTEAEWATPGEGVVVTDFEKARVGGWICYDTRFPETGRLCLLQGAELCLVPTAWLGPGEEWELSLRARALDNCMFVAGSDLINGEPGLICRGLSMIIGPHGDVLARAEPGVECVIDAVLDPKKLEAQRKRLPLLRDRRPGLYGPLTK